MNNFKSGFVSIVGVSNVGKSTLINQIIKNKVSIVTDKAQTTRNSIQGIYNDSNAQIVFIDTPGVHISHNFLGNIMNDSVFKTLKGIEVILFVFPANFFIDKNNIIIMNKISKLGIPIILVISKSDLSSKEEIESKVEAWNKLFNFVDFVAISALKDKNINLLVETIKKLLKQGPKYFNSDNYTDKSESFLITEIIREKILILTQKEVPHSSAVIIDKIKESDSAMEVYASIIVERKSQKPILIGKNGKMIKRIRILATKEIQDTLNKKITLELFVKVQEKWRNTESLLKKIGYGK